MRNPYKLENQTKMYEDRAAMLLLLYFGNHRRSFTLFHISASQGGFLQ
jgi:hypothetical protein